MRVNRDSIVEANMKYNDPVLMRILSQYWLEKSRYEVANDSFGENSFGRIVYIDSEPPKIISSAISTCYRKKPTFRKEFNNILSEIKPKKYWKLLMLATLYFSEKTNAIVSMLVCKNERVRSGSLLAGILEESNYYLLYSYQLERIIQSVFKCSHQESVLFRKEYNKINKIPERYLECYDEVQLFGEILSQTHFIRGLHHPNIDGAKNLFEFYGGKFV